MPGLDLVTGRTGQRRLEGIRGHDDPGLPQRVTDVASGVTGSHDDLHGAAARARVVLRCRELLVEGSQPQERDQAAVDEEPALVMSPGGPGAATGQSAAAGQGAAALGPVPPPTLAFRKVGVVVIPVGGVGGGVVAVGVGAGRGVVAVGEVGGRVPAWVGVVGVAIRGRSVGTVDGVATTMPGGTTVDGAAHTVLGGTTGTVPALVAWGTVVRTVIPGCVVPDPAVPRP